MFGRHERLEEELRERGRSAMATILEAEQTHWAVSRGPDEVVANTQIVWKLKLRVTPEGEPPFEAAIEQAWPQLDTPRAGRVVPVLFDPDDHSKVAVDHSDSAQKAAAAGMFESRLTPNQAAAIQQFAGAPLSDLMSQVMADPQGFAARMRERAAEAQQAAMGQAAAAAQQGAPPPPAPAAPAEDPIAALTRLADLRDRGVLTDEEFQAQKKRILGE